MLRLFTLLILAWPVFPALFRAVLQDEPVEEPPRAEILSPQPGQALQGSVPVIADLPSEGVQAVEVSFSYTGDGRETWFFIDEVLEPPLSKELWTWDTTTLTDGIYTLRLSVRMSDGGQEIIDVTGLRVRNYTPVETNTPEAPTATGQEEGVGSTSGPQAPAAVLIATLQATPDPLAGSSGQKWISTPETLTTNPAQVTYQAVMASLGKGALAAGAIFLLLGVYRGSRQMKRNRRDAA